MNSQHEYRNRPPKTDDTPVPLAPDVECRSENTLSIESRQFISAPTVMNPLCLLLYRSFQPEIYACVSKDSPKHGRIKTF
jgi:hypothetical protein